MAISKKELKWVFQEVIASEFVEIPEAEDVIEYTFSEEFEKKMEDLIEAQRRPSWSIMTFARKRVAMIAIVFLGLFITACGVTQIIYHLHENIYKENRQELLGNSEFQEGETVYHSLSYLPEGFKKVSVSRNSYSKTMEYENESGDKIYFVQDTKGETRYILNEEQVIVENIQIDDKEVDLYKNNQLMGAIWIEDGIYMEILFYGCEDMEELITIIKGIK